MKKILSFIIILALLMSLLPSNIFAATATEPSDVPDTDPQTYNTTSTNAEQTEAVLLSSDGFESGDGSASSPFIIKTPEQLSFLADSSLNGETYEGKYISFADDIDMSDYAWAPIRNFKGTLCGNNFTIENLSISNSSQISISGSVYSLGFIAENYGTVKDLNFSYISINISPDYNLVCGAIVGDNYGTISNCDAHGNITCTASSVLLPNLYLGGIAGCNYKDFGIYNCNSSVNISGTVPYTPSPDNIANTAAVIAGGITGLNYGNISVCFSSGSVSGIGRFAYVGGLVGQLLEGTILNSYSTANVSATAIASARCAGGLVGNNNGTSTSIKNCYFATGTVTAICQHDNTNAFSGGIIGKAEGCQIYSCFATGKLVASTYFSNASGDKITGIGYAGQIIGHSSGSNTITISNCYYSSDMSIERTTSEAFTYEWTEGSGCDAVQKSETRYKHNVATTANTVYGTSTTNSNFKTSSFITGTLGWTLYSKLSNVSSYNNVWLMKTSYPELHISYNYSVRVIMHVDDTVYGVYYKLGDLGDSFNCTAIQIPYYTPKMSSISGSISNTDQVYRIGYTRTMRNINIVCKDQDGKAIKVTSVKVAEGTSYSIEAPQIVGYTPRETAISGNMGTENIQIELIYDVNEYTVNLQFSFADGKSAATTYTALRKYGEEIIIDTPQVLGYEIATQSLDNLTITDATIHIPATCAENIEETILYSEADVQWYTFAAMLGTTPLQDVSVTVDGVTKTTDKNGRVMFSYQYGTEEVLLTIHKDGFSSGLYELPTSYKLKTDLGIDYFNMKIDTASNPHYSVQGISCYGNDIEKDYGIINVKYDGYVPIVVKANLPSTDKIVKMQLVQEVDSAKVSTEDGETLPDFADGTMVRKILKTIEPSDTDSFETVNGVLTGVCAFKLLGTQFSYQAGKEYPIYVYMYTENGSEPVIQKLNIKVIKLATNIKFDGLFDSTEITIKDTGLNFLDGTKLSFELGDDYKVNCPFSIEIQNNEIYVAYDMTDDFEYAFKTYSQATWNSYKELRDSEKRANDYMKHMAKKVDEKFAKGSWKDPVNKASFSLDASAAAGMCFTVYDDGKTAQYSYFKLGITAKASWTSDFVLIFIPITVQASISAEGEITITGLGYDFEHQKVIFPSTEMSLNVTLGLSAGIGNRYASVGAFGRFSIGTKLVIGETTYFDALILNGQAGFYAKLDLGLFTLYGEKAWTFLDKTIHFAPQKSIKTLSSPSTDSGEYIGEYNNLPVYNASAYNLEDDLTVTIPDWQVSNSTMFESPSASSGGDIYTAIDNANERIVLLGAKKIAIYFARSNERDSANAKVLVYRVYDEVNEKWSDPSCVEDNGTGDTGFDVIKYKNNLYIAYNEANRVFDANNYQDDASLINDITFSQDIRIAVFDILTNSFVSVTKITSDSNYDTLPTFGIANDTLYLVWNKNTSHDNSTAFCMNDQNHVWYKSFDGYTWSESTMLLSGCYPIVDMALSELSGAPYISLIIDEDASLYTDDDKNLYISDLSGNITHINCYGTTISDLQAVKANNTPLLLWKCDNKVMALSDINSEPYVFSGQNHTVAENYVYINIDEDLSALLWAVKDVNSENANDILSQIYISYKYGDNDWTTPSILTTVPYHLMSFSVTSSYEQLYLLFTDTYMLTNETDTEQTLSSFSKLCYRSLELSGTITTNHYEVYVDKEQDIVTVTVTVTNDGAAPIVKIGITLTDIIKPLVKPSGGRFDNSTRSSNSTTVQTSGVSEEQYKEIKNYYSVGKFVVNLLPGQSTTITAEIALTPEMSLENYIVSAYVVTGMEIEGGVVITPTVGGSSTPPDDSDSQGPTYPDLSVSGEYIIVGETEYLSIRVENIGNGNANGTLELFRIEQDGSLAPVYSSEIVELMKNNVKYYLIKLDKDFFAATLDNFLCIVSCNEDTDLSNNQITVLARKLEGAPGSVKDTLVEIPILSQYQQTFDKYNPTDIVLNVTINDDLLRFVGCIDENQRPVTPDITEDGYNQTLTFRQRDLSLLENRSHEISLIYLTDVGYVDVIYTLDVIDSTPILIEGSICVLVETNSDQTYADSCIRGSTLTIDASSVNTDQLTYEWIVDGTVVSNMRTYVVSEEYLGREIRARVTGIAPYYGTLTAQPVYMQKVNRILNAPVVLNELSDTTIVVQKAFHVGDDKLQYGYSTQNDSSTVNNWQYSNQLTLPESGIYYLFTKATESNIYAPVISDGTKYANVSIGILTGNITSFSSEIADITIQLIPEGQARRSYELVVNGDYASYAFHDVIYGNYIMRVSKENHTTREYVITIDNDSIMHNIDMSLFGDINVDGIINSLDLIALRTVLFSSDINYLNNIACDLNADGKINLLDLSRLKRFLAGYDVSLEAFVTVDGNYVIQDSKVRLLGDVNNDGVINSSDLTLLRTVIFASDVNYIDNITCDLNADGKINLLDLSRLKSYLAGVNMPLGSIE